MTDEERRALAENMRECARESKVAGSSDESAIVATWIAVNCALTGEVEVPTVGEMLERLAAAIWEG